MITLTVIFIFKHNENIACYTNDLNFTMKLKTLPKAEEKNSKKQRAQ